MSIARGMALALGCMARDGALGGDDPTDTDTTADWMEVLSFEELYTAYLPHDI